MVSWFVVWLVLACVAMIVSFMLATQTWEHHRFARNRKRALLDLPKYPRVLLLAPCKGIDLELADNLRPLLEQDYANYTVRFIVESNEDPAAGVIRRLLAEHPGVDARLVIAGKAHCTGQKVHNLRVATRDLPPDIEVLAFVDSDARPNSYWLRTLTQRLDREGTGAVTGYRWFVPQRGSLANCLLYGINASAASLYNPVGFHAVWGGSWAIRRELFDQLAVRTAWAGTLSDDLVITGLLARHRLRIEFEPGCMLASPVDTRPGAMWNFLRRQYVLGRFHLPQLWWLTLSTTTLGIVGFWGGIAWTLAALLTQPAWAWVPALPTVALYGLSVLRGWLRRDLARLYMPHITRPLQAAMTLDVWANPLTALVNWLAMLSSVGKRRLTWRGIRYQLRRGGRVQCLERGDSDDEQFECIESACHGRHAAARGAVGNQPLTKVSSSLT